ncbi:MAG: hypothetical protein IT443_04595 [Phycisphaeraceae bacterium]|nr:hypothetical protein [Phycisphaeraceae bacterium]
MTIFSVFFADGPDGRRCSWRLVALFALINSLVLFNAIWHDPSISYDASAHLSNALALSEGRMPTSRDGVEFFSPPLPYLPAAMAMAVGRWMGAAPKEAFFNGAKVGQVGNVIWSLLLTWGLLSVGQRLERRSPQPVSDAALSWGDGQIRIGMLGLILLLPVYFKTFAMIRGEPAVAALAVLAVDQILRSVDRGRYGIWRGLALGVTLGLLALGRQWGVLLLPAAVLATWAAWRRERPAADPSARRCVLAMALAATLATALVGGWFYVRLHQVYGSCTAFNRPLRSLALANHAPSFYLDPAWDELLTTPVRPAFAMRMLPIMWSEIWGDYWGYWVVYSRDDRFPNGRYLDGIQFQDALAVLRQQATANQSPTIVMPSWLHTNYLTMPAYLGTVNALAVVPGALLLTCFVMACRRAGVFVRQSFCRSFASSFSVADLAMTLVVTMTLVTVAGYMVFLIRVPPESEGDTIKAAYLLQVLVLLAIPWGIGWRQAWKIHPRFARWLAVLIFMITIHNAPLLVTRFLRFWY